MLLLYVKATQRILFRAGISSALPLALSNLYENLMKLIFFWQCKFGNCQGTLFLFSLTHISGLENSENYAQDFNNTNATQSNRKSRKGEAKTRTECAQVQLWKYFWIFFSCLITVSWKGFLLAKIIEKDNFLIETTYATANLGKKKNYFNPEWLLKIL